MIRIIKKECDNLMLEQYNLRLEKKKTFIKSRLKENICYTTSMYPIYEKETVQELTKEYSYDLVVECMIELLEEGEENEKI